MSISMVPGRILPSPSKCVCCGDGDRDCIDFGLTLQFYGAVLLCVTCVAQAIRTWGPQLDAASLADYNELLSENITLKNKLSQLPALEEELANAVLTAVSKYNNDRDLLDGSRSSSNSDTESTSDNRQDSGSSAQIDRQAGSDKRDKKPSRVPSNSSNVFDTAI